ncbi:hypothetical protein Cgig2_034105 [Carnegiea gigantea]|uniref:Uncharacterized protein n=1 Tax=Carnegiea gigantea TaxID=171969 RepID=A0A9Q1JE45_9CARY|nr:hypothetical protein Cgig2_034105 [Carnegiea gigantea]
MTIVRFEGQRLRCLTLSNVKSVVTHYLLLIQFELNDGKVGTLYKDQKMARECYYMSLKSLGMKKEPLPEVNMGGPPSRVTSAFPLGQSSRAHSRKDEWVADAALECRRGLYLFLVVPHLLPDRIKRTLHDMLKRNGVKGGESMNYTLKTRKKKVMASKIESKGKD